MCETCGFTLKINCYYFSHMGLYFIRGFYKENLSFLPKQRDCSPFQKEEALFVCQTQARLSLTSLSEQKKRSSWSSPSVRAMMTLAVLYPGQTTQTHSVHPATPRKPPQPWESSSSKLHHLRFSIVKISTFSFETGSCSSIKKNMEQTLRGNMFCFWVAKSCL